MSRIAFSCSAAGRNVWSVDAVVRTLRDSKHSTVTRLIDTQGEGSEGYQPWMEFLESCDALVQFHTSGRPAPELYYEMGVAVSLKKTVLAVVHPVASIAENLPMVSVIRIDPEQRNYIFAIMRYIEAALLVSMSAPHEDNMLTTDEFVTHRSLVGDAGPEGRINTLTSYAWEQYVQRFFEKQGADVSLTSDSAFDLLIRSKDEPSRKVAVQVKHLRRGDKIGLSDVQRFAISVSELGFDKAILVSSTDFTAAARAFVNEYARQIELWTPRNLYEEEESLDATE